MTAERTQPYPDCADSATRRLSIGLRIADQNPGHTRFDVFAALSDADWLDWADITRSNTGTLTMRTDEFDAFVGALQATASIASDIHLDVYRGDQPHHEAADGCMGVEYHLASTDTEVPS